jgi:hypothetical protein
MRSGLSGILKQRNVKQPWEGVVSQFEFEHSEYQWVISQTETLPGKDIDVHMVRA